MTYNTWITNSNDSCDYRLPCGICRVSNQICPKHSSNTYITYPTYNTSTSQTAEGKPDEKFSITCEFDKGETE